MPKRKKQRENADVAGDEVGQPARATLKPWMRAFLTAFSLSCNIKEAAADARVSEASVWKYRKLNPDFAQAYRDAEAMAVERLKSVVVNRAINGDRRLKFNTKTGDPFMDPATGKPYEEVEYSDSLQLALLEAHDRERYGKQNKVEVSGGIVHAVIGVQELQALQERRAAALAKGGAIEAETEKI